MRGATAILAVTLFFSNVLGVIRDHFLAQKIPAGTLDTYFAAFRLPDLIFNALILAAVSSAFLPVFTDFLAKGKLKQAFHVANTLISSSMIGLFVLLGVLYGAMPLFITHLVPNFSADNIALTIHNARILLLSPLIFGLSFIVSSMLNSWKRFVATSFSPLIYNGAIIVGTVLFADRYSIQGVVWAVVVGSLLHLLIQLPTLFGLGFRFRPSLDLGNDAVHRIWALTIPRALGLGANQIMLLAFTSIAARIGTGAIAIYTFADNIQTTPTVIFATSIAQALFPTLAEHYALEKHEQFGYHIERAINAIVFILLPMAVGMVLLRAQIVRLILGSGYFGWEQTREAASVVGWFGMGLVFSALLPLIHRIFFAMQNTLIPTIGGIVAVVVAIVSAQLLAPVTHISALPIGFSLGAMVEFVLLYAIVVRQVHINQASLGLNSARVAVATLVMALAVQGGKIAVGQIIPLTHSLAVLLQLGVATALGVLVYFPVTHFLGHPGIDLPIKQFIVNRIYGQRNGRL